MEKALHGGGEDGGTTPFQRAPGLRAGSEAQHVELKENPTTTKKYYHYLTLD